jgi:hypothetical protein
MSETTDFDWTSRSVPAKSEGVTPTVTPTATNRRARPNEERRCDPDRAIQSNPLRNGAREPCRCPSRSAHSSYLRSGLLSFARSFQYRGKVMSTPSIPALPEPSGTFFGTAATGCFSYAALALMLMHLLRPDLRPVSHMISEYAVGPFGWVMQSVFVGLSLGCAALLAGLAFNGPPSIAARLGVALLGVASVGLIVSAVYPMDLPGAPATRAGEMHDLSFLINVGSIALAIVLLTIGFGSDLRWRSFRRASSVLFSFIALAFVLQFLTLHKGAPYGLANRFFISVVLAWLISTSVRLRNLSRR